MFVERLADALIDPDTRLATGLVVGLTGEWGSGKTSILNLLAEELNRRHGNLALLRFDPWLISGREDLTRQFLADLFRAVMPHLPVGRAHVFTSYAEGVSAKPLGGWLSKSAIGWFSRKAPLAETKEALGFLLSNLTVPIVALIDELDRIQDDEIVATARLIRSIADFPNISYVVAYDAPRVIQALGSGDDERGQSYLQKIVQIQIPIPIILKEEIETLYLAELGELMPSRSRSDDRLRHLLHLLTQAGFRTPRSIRNITSNYIALRRLVRDEVSAIDLLGYCALLGNAPKSMGYIRQNPDHFVHDSRDPTLYFVREGAKREAWLDRLKKGIPEIAENPKLWELVTFLFPSLETGQSTREPEPDSISHRHVLLTTLRLGLVPGAYSEEEIATLESLAPSDAAAFIHKAYDDGRWEAFDERIRRWIRADRSDKQIERIFFALSTAANHTSTGWVSYYGHAHRLSRYTIDFITSLCRHPNFKPVAKRFVNGLLASGRQPDIAAALVRRHFWAYGIFGREQRPYYDEFAFMTQEEVKIAAAEIGSRTIEALKSSKLLQSIVTGHPFFVAIDLGLWSDAAAEQLTGYLPDVDALRAIALMFYTPEGTIEKAGMARLLDRDLFVKGITRVIEDPPSDLDEGTLICLKLATREDAFS